MISKTYVRIGEAARAAGVSVETLRRWEREGKFSAARTFGGQRTYLLSDIARLLDDGESEDMDAKSEPMSPQVPSVAIPPTVLPWKAREANAAADLSVARLKIERREEIRRYREEEQRRLTADQTATKARLAEAQCAARRESERQQQQSDIASCLRTVRIELIGEPSDVRAEVERFIGEHAHPGKSIEWIKAECRAIISRHRVRRNAVEESAREAKRQIAIAKSTKELDDFRLSLLVSRGKSLAGMLTADREEWDGEAAEEAVDAVGEHLNREIALTWTEKRIESEVRSILSEWD